MGPSVQMPGALSQMFEVVTDGEGNVTALQLRQDWAAFFQSIQQIAFASSRAGSTTARPTSDFPGRYVGMPFFDQTLGLPVFLMHASSNVWVKADGSVA